MCCLQRLQLYEDRLQQSDTTLLGLGWVNTGLDVSHFVWMTHWSEWITFSFFHPFLLFFHKECRGFFFSQISVTHRLTAKAEVELNWKPALIKTELLEKFYWNPLRHHIRQALAMRADGWWIMHPSSFLFDVCLFVCLFFPIMLKRKKSSPGQGEIRPSMKISWKSVSPESTGQGASDFPWKYSLLCSLMFLNAKAEADYFLQRCEGASLPGGADLFGEAESLDAVIEMFLFHF